jgi:hypothetical protein
MLVEVKPDFFFQGEMFIEDRGKPAEHLMGYLFKNYIEKALLGAVIVMEQGLIDTGPVGNILHAGTVHSFFNEDLGGGIKDSPFGLPVVICH